MKEKFKELISDFQENPLPSFKKREINIPLNSGKIISIIGPRRSGKSHLMYQLISKLDKKKVVYINFEDERFNITTKDLDSILKAYYELYPENKEIYFFFDEIQEVQNWEKFVRRIYDTVSKNIFLTGSSAKLLSKEIATSLRGRTITFEVFPLSFKEFLKFKEVEINIYSSRGSSRLINNFRDYMHCGGFPEVINFNNLIWNKTIQQYFNVMLYKDIIERYKVANTTVLKLFLKKLFSNVSKEFSINKIYNEFKSHNYKIGKEYLYDFLDYSEDSYMLFVLEEYSNKLNLRSFKKIYSVDIALSKINSYAFDKDLGRLLENIVFIELKRRNKEIYYHRDKHECDFV
ncbi:MAG: ATP-binding protein, partial [Candidatus Woesearchaeota archaeon]